jgi:hypothetical protein
MELELGIPNNDSINSICSINNFDKSTDSPRIQDNTRQNTPHTKNPNTENIIYSYHVLCHIFIFSVFESFFFWFYIVPQENKMIKNQFKTVNMLTNMICINTNVNLDPFYDYIESEREEYNNNSSLKFTIYMNTTLGMFIAMYNIYFKLHDHNHMEINKKVFKEQMWILLFLFIYEYLFFQNIIYMYKPKDLMSYDKYLFTQCS